MIEHLVQLVMWFVDSVSDVDQRPIARKVALGCLLAGAIALFILSTLYRQRKR
jgi:hypothetical protein